MGERRHGGRTKRRDDTTDTTDESRKSGTENRIEIRSTAAETKVFVPKVGTTLLRKNTTGTVANAATNGNSKPTIAPRGPINVEWFLKLSPKSPPFTEDKRDEDDTYGLFLHVSTVGTAAGRFETTADVVSDQRGSGHAFAASRKCASVF